MAITKRTELKEEILPNQVIQIRTTTVVEEDGVELARATTATLSTLDMMQLLTRRYKTSPEFYGLQV